VLCDFEEEDQITCEEDSESYEPELWKARAIFEEEGWSIVDGRAYCPAHTQERKTERRHTYGNTITDENI
jgi:hypothetical protein